MLLVVCGFESAFAKMAVALAAALRSRAVFPLAPAFKLLDRIVFAALDRSVQRWRNAYSGWTGLSSVGGTPAAAGRTPPELEDACSGWTHTSSAIEGMSLCSFCTMRSGQGDRIEG